jgi:flagellar basal-body rod protein FlgB
MPSTPLFSETISILEKSLNFRSKRHQVLSTNIANMDTPNYKAFELVFEQEFKKAPGRTRGVKLVRTDERHFPISPSSRENVKLKQAEPPEFTLRGDGNTVDMDKTMGDLAENTLLYKTLAQMISKKFLGLKNVIQGGK